MIWFVALALLWLGAADAFARELPRNYDPAAGARRNRGVVVISLTMPMREDARWGGSHVWVWYQRANNPWSSTILDMPRDAEARRNTASEFPNVYGQLRAIELQAGEYELNKFDYLGPGVSFVESPLPPLRFTVRPGRVTYLGRVHVDEFDLPGSFFGWPRFVDARDEDLPILLARYPQLTAESVDFGNPDPSEWTRIWARVLTCSPWDQARYDGYRAVQPEGVFAWQRDFREYALTLATCDHHPWDLLGRHFFNMQQNLVRADVRWEGVVREISVGDGGIALALDTGTDDVRARVFTSGMVVRPSEASINCCIVSGDIESWRAVQVGDTIAMQGTLGLLQFSTDPAAPVTVTPTLRNARAEVLRRP